MKLRFLVPGLTMALVISLTACGSNLTDTKSQTQTTSPLTTAVTTTVITATPVTAAVTTTTVTTTAVTSGVVDSGDDPAQTVVENYFKFNNEKNKDKILTTLTEHHDAPNVVWGFDELDSIKILNIEEEKDNKYAKGYLLNGRGSINGTTDDNLKVYKVKYEVKYKNEVGAQESGTYDWWYFLIRKDSSSPWLIDDFGV